MEDITLDNYLSVNIEDITLNRNKLGELVFEGINSKLIDLQGLFKALNELNYQSTLLPQQIAEVESLSVQFVERLNQIRTFDIGQPNPKQLHDALEQNLDNFYNSSAERLRNFLVYLRQEAESKSKDQQELQKQIKETTQVRAQLEATLKDFQKEYRTIVREKSKVERGRGQLASKILAKHFDEEADYFENQASKWLKNRWWFFFGLSAIVAFNLIMFAVLKTGFWFFHKVDVNDFFDKQYLVIKLALVALLSYGLVFSSRNYRINSNLAVINRHRRSVAQTIEDYLGTNPSQPIQEQIIKEGVSAMFQHVNNGYLSNREGSGDGNPATEFITNIVKNFSDGSG